MALPAIPTAKVLEAIAAILQKGDADPLADTYLEICDEANRLAISDVYRILTIRGFSEAQIQSADDLGRWNLDQAIYWSLMRAGALSNMPDHFAKSFDRRKELMDSPAILIGGAAQAPGGNDGGGGVSYGRLSAWKRNRRKYDAFGGNLFD